MTEQKIEQFKFKHPRFERTLDAHTPASMYSVLLEHGMMSDPFFAMNEKAASALSDCDCDFYAEFDISKEIMSKPYVVLSLVGIDTVADIILNGVRIERVENMHRRYELDIRGIAREKANLLQIHIYSPTRYIADKYGERQLWSGSCAADGVGYIRKAYCSFGWDWGPKLADMGIQGSVSVLGYDTKIDVLTVSQRHMDGKAELDLSLECIGKSEYSANAYISFNGQRVASADFFDGRATLKINEAKLWYPRGYGEQVLYELVINIYSDSGELLDRDVRKIGLRTLTVSRKTDEYGREFCFFVNGIKIFARGANYIPEDSVFPRMNRQRTQKLLQSAAEANFNCIRVWGGGFYPSEDFYELCDQMGFIVWQDFMFALSYINMTDSFVQNLKEEFKYNLCRISTHASLGLLCGNNEIEEAIAHWKVPKSEEIKRDYCELYEQILPDMCARYAKDTFYWPSTPSSGGGFESTDSQNDGDMHLNSIWFANILPEQYEKYFPRFISECTMQALPDIKSIRAFTGEHSPNVFSPVMDAHQKDKLGNPRILTLMAPRYLMPKNVEEFAYLSQVHQADCICSVASHLRSHRGRCMGFIFWQFNDCWPTASWSCIDYYGRKKALMYRIKKAYADIAVFASNSKEIFVCNERTDDFCGTLEWTLGEGNFNIAEQGSLKINISALSSERLDIPQIQTALSNREDSLYLCLVLKDGDGKEVYGACRTFVPQKYFKSGAVSFKTNVKKTECGYEIHVSADGYARFAKVECDKYDIVLSDNYFDIISPESVVIKAECSDDVSAEDMCKSLRIICLENYNEVIK